MCRNWGGGPFLTVHAENPVQFTGEEHITRFESSPWAQRGFCNKCGTHLFYHLKGKFYAVPLGLLEDSDKFEFKMQIYTDCRPESYEFANKTKMMTEAEIIAKFST